MRKLLLVTLIITTCLIFVSRLFYLQIYKSKPNNLLADNAIRKVYTYPKRGYVYDRNGVLLVANQASYDVMVIPNNLRSFDTLEFCNLLKIEKAYLNERLTKAKYYSWKLPYVVLSHLSKEDYAFLQEKMHHFKGFYIQKRSIRNYHTSIGANVLGNIGEVDNKEIKTDAYYTAGDLIGKQGVESSYEKILRGTKGIKFIQKDRHNKDIGSYKNGVYDTLAVPGKDITITIDSKLQAYGETLMANKRGGIIAIEPSSGEILSMVTAPSYNPNLLVGRSRSKNFNKLYKDSISKPLYDRGLLAQYPPGSPFKVLNALIGLQEGIITTNDKFICRLGYKYGNKFMGCHSHKSLTNMNLGIYQSCNTYFANVYRKIIGSYKTPYQGLNAWNKHITSFGLGNYLGYDLNIGRPGRIPNGDFYNKWYPKNKWYATYTLSNAIGQGEVETTPIQLANVTAAIANRGYFYTPHIIKSIEGQPIDTNYTTPKYTTIDKKHFEPVIQGMFDVYNKGTAKALQVNGIEICGKTGTAENFVKINDKKTQLTDHSIFVAFAPKDNPKIAIAAFVENGHYGNIYAGKIASLMIEKYLKNTISRVDLETWILNNSLEEEYKKPLSGKSFFINGNSKFIKIDETYNR